MLRLLGLFKHSVLELGLVRAFRVSIALGVLSAIRLSALETRTRLPAALGFGAEAFKASCKAHWRSLGFGV